jgi:hypothetical protein
MGRLPDGPRSYRMRYGLQGICVHCHMAGEIRPTEACSQPFTIEFPDRHLGTEYSLGLWMWSESRRERLCGVHQEPRRSGSPLPHDI